MSTTIVSSSFLCKFFMQMIKLAINTNTEDNSCSHAATHDELYI